MPPVTEDLQATVQRHIAQVAGEMSPTALAEDMADFLIESIPEFASSTDQDFRSGLFLSCASNLVEIKERLVSGAPSDQLSPPPPDAIAWAHELVHRGMELAALLRAYRLGHGFFEQSFEQLASELDLEPDIRWRVLATASRYVFKYVDTVCTRLVQDYEAERDHWTRGAAAVQAELARAIVEGKAVEPAEATETLGYDVTWPQLAFIVWGDPRVRGMEHATSLASGAKALAAELGGGPVLLIPMGEHLVWAWTAGERLAECPPARSAALGDRAHAAVGTPHEGLAGMFRSHHEALAARRVGEVLGCRPGALVCYQSVALTALISADPAQAVRFAEAELGQLGSEADAMMRLRATLRVYFEENRSPVRTARRLSIHQNTVVYRVKRVEEIIARPVDERRLELEVALRLYDGLDGLRAASAPGPA